MFEKMRLFDMQQSTAAVFPSLLEPRKVELEFFGEVEDSRCQRSSAVFTSFTLVQQFTHSFF